MVITVDGKCNNTQQTTDFRELSQYRKIPLLTDYCLSIEMWLLFLDVQIAALLKLKGMPTFVKGPVCRN